MTAMGVKSVRVSYGRRSARACATPWLLLFASNRVCPSGADFAAMALPSTFPAPGRLSTTTGWPSLSVNRAPTSRATKSTPPPGVTGTMSRMVRVGYVCAHAPAESMATVNTPEARMTSCFGHLIRVPCEPTYCDRSWNKRRRVEVCALREQCSPEARAVQSMLTLHAGCSALEPARSDSGLRVIALTTWRSASSARCSTVRDGRMRGVSYRSCRRAERTASASASCAITCKSAQPPQVHDAATAFPNDRTLKPTTRTT